MKKLISLLLCLIVLAGVIPASAASLTPEKVIGTWDISKCILNGVTYGAGKIEGKNYYLFNADGTGSFIIKSPSLNRTEKFKWSIDGNTVITDCKGAQTLLTLKGSCLVYTSSTGELSDYYRKTKDTTDKTVTKAILSSGTYKLDNGKKTAVFTAPPVKKAASLKIPDTIRVNGKVYKVTEIKAKACARMTGLAVLTIGKNVKVIGDSAFSGCSLRKITIKGASLSKVGTGAFSGAQASAVVTCPKSKLAKYRRLLQKAGLPDTAVFNAK